MDFSTNHLMKRIIITLFVVIVASVSIGLLIRIKKTEVKTEISTTSETMGIESVPTPEVQDAHEEVKPVVAKGYGEINENGTSTKFVLDIPVDGGSIKGSASGFCQGPIEGVYDPRTDFIQGTMKGDCFFVAATGTFDGKVVLKTKSGSGKYSGKSLDQSKSGAWSLVIK